MAQLNLGLFALVGVIMLVLAGASFGYLLRVPDKSRASRLLMWFFLSTCGSAVATILTNLGMDWSRAFAYLQDALVIVGGIFLVRFAYLYPLNDQPREARLLSAIYSVPALVVLIYALYFAYQYLTNLPLQLAENRAYYLFTPLAVVFVVGLFFRRFWHWRRLAEGSSTEPSRPDQGTLLPAPLLYRRAASALRDFGIAMSLGLIPVIVTILPDFWPFLRGFLTSFLFNFSVVLAISALMLVYLSHAPDPTTILARLVGISLAAVMLLLGLVAVWVVLNTPPERISETVLTFSLMALGSGAFVLLIFPQFFRFTLLEPLDRLLMGVRMANEGQLDVQVAVKYRDEIGLLTDSFNRMTTTLNEKTHALAEATQHLEQQVAERTQALEGSNLLLLQQNTYQRALSRCSTVLLRPAGTEAERNLLLNEALSHLMQAVQASRAYLFKNRLDLIEGEIMSMQAEAAAPGVRPHLPVPGNRFFPWSGVPQEMHATLQAGKPYGGPVEQSFASRPELVEAFLSQQPPLLSVMLFPVILDGDWWGYIGFDDCQQPRQWDEQEIQLLRTGAGMLSSVLQRWQREDENLAQTQAQQALAQVSRLLLQHAATRPERQAAMSQALRLLIAAAGASRGYLFQNQGHPRNGLSLQLVAAVNAPEVNAHLGGPLAGHIPWGLLPQATRTTLEQGQPAGGPVEQVLGGSPEMLDALQSDPILSVQFFPIHFGGHWWGMLGFDDIETVRSWGEQELLLLRTGADLFSQTLSRWEANDQLQHTLDTLEEQVKQRTHQLSISNARLLEEIDERKTAQHNLENRLATESTLAGISQALMIARDLPAVIWQSLAELGRLLAAQRVSLFMISGQSPAQSDEIISWQADGIGALTPEEARQYHRLFPWQSAVTDRPQAVYLYNGQQYPGAALPGLLEQTPPAAIMLLVPLVAQNDLIGALVCENIAVSGSKEEASQLLEVAAGILSGALAHQKLLDDLERKVNARSRELAALYDLAILGGRSSALRDVLQPMLSRIIEITASQAASLYLIDASRLRLVVQLGLSAEQMEQKPVISLTDGLQDWLAQRTDELAEPWPPRSPAPLSAFSLPAFKHLQLVRLSARERIHGVLCCYRQGEKGYSPTQLSTLTALGEQLGVIIENHRLRQEAEALAGLQERQRLARELHDSVSQSLYSLTLFARAGRDALESADQEKLAQSLAEVEVNSKIALREMRLLLYELRSEAVDQGLEQALLNRFQLVEHRLGIRTELEFEDSIRLTPAVEQELFRLISEALNNAVKHAEARRVSVRLERTEAQLCLLVTDDGCGFDPQQAPAGLGLGSMQARAELLGGVLEIASQPGAGTQVRLSWPADIQSAGVLDE